MNRLPVPCPTCGRIRRLRPCDARTVFQCRRCHLRQIAPSGFQAAAAKYGRFFAIDKARQWRLDHPSTLEQQVETALVQIEGITWEREYEVNCGDNQKWFVDFLIYAGRRRIALEVQGAWVHAQDEDIHHLTIRTRCLQDCFDALIFLYETQIRSPDFTDQLVHLLGVGAVS